MAASARVVNRMVRVICKAKPVGDILTRQPKQPGQGPQDYNRVRVVPDAPSEQWANTCKNGNARCVKCGTIGHDEVTR